MLEAGEGLHLAAEHAEASVVDVASTADDLERDRTLGVLLFGLVDDAHAARAERPHDAEIADQGRTGRGCRRGRGGVVTWGRRGADPLGMAPR